MFHGIKSYWSSVKDHRRLQRFSAILGKVYSPDELAGLIISRTNPKDDALDRLVHLCITRAPCLPVIQKYSLSSDDLRNIYERLLVNGGGHWVAGHFIAVSSIFYAQTLEFLAQNIKQGKPIDISVGAALHDYFQEGRRDSV